MQLFSQMELINRHSDANCWDVEAFPSCSVTVAKMTRQIIEPLKNGLKP